MRFLQPHLLTPQAVFLKKEIELFGTNSGGRSGQVVGRVGELLKTHQVDDLVGTHLSNIRVTKPTHPFGPHEKDEGDHTPVRSVINNDDDQ